jgi:chromosome segregation ATPase
MRENAKFDERLSTAQRGLRDLEALLERESLTRDEIAAEGVRRELDRRACEKSLTRGKQLLLRETRANAQVTYLLNETLTNARAIADIIEDFERTKAALERELSAATSDTKRTIDERNALKLEVNERREECKAEISKGDLLAHTVTVTVRQEIADLEDEVKCLRREEAARNRIQKYVADRVSRAMKRHQGVQQNIAQLQSLLRIRNAEIMDVKSNIDDARERRSHFERLQELTTTQRDTFATIVRKSEVIAGALRRKSKRLDVQKLELERHTQEKDWAVSAVRGETDVKKRERDARRNQNDAVSHVILRARADVEVSETELGKLKNEFEAGKCDQELLFEQSKTLVKSRQAVAVELLDRNDELCRLCDRIATSEDVSRQCEEELALRVHECETLRRRVHEIERSLIIARRNVATIPGYQAEISSKRSTLYEMRMSAENLSQRLEDPKEHTRWRLIHGPKGEEENDVDVDDVNDKLASVGSRIQDQERELTKRRLRCQDIDREIERLRTVIAENTDEALETASSLNRAKSKLSAVERALLAAVSELTMYRALTAALADAKSRNIAEVDALRLSLEEINDEPIATT